jgi:hypothetical protein
MGLFLEGERVLHPVDVVAVGEIFAGVGSTGFLAVGSGSSSLDTRMIEVRCDTKQKIR